MKIPAFSISILMGVVAVVALGVGAGRGIIHQTLLGHRSTSDVVIVGILPMAGVLGVGLLPLLARKGLARDRPGLLGFEALGALATSLYFAASVPMGDRIVEGVGHALRHFPRGSPTFLALAVALQLLPLLAMATFGAWLGRAWANSSRAWSSNAGR